MDFTNFDFFPSDNYDFGNAAEKAFERLSFAFTKEHIEHLISAALDENSSENDRYVCASILKNAQISSKMRFPLCQDTGIATVFGWASRGFSFSGNESEQIRNAAKKIYDEKKLRFSTSVPTSFFDEIDPKNNMPPQISIFAKGCSLAPEPDFAKNIPDGSAALLFVAKGGGSSNKTSFIQGTKAFLNPAKFTELMKEQISKFGTSACPPYSIGIVAGGLSPEQNLLALKLATAGAYSEMTTVPNECGFRDEKIEKLAMEIAKQTGFGAQFGGNAFALSATAVRLSRHGASCPISFGVSCSAHRNLRAIVAKDGFYIEKCAFDLEKIPRFSEAVEILSKESKKSGIELNSNGEISELLEKLRDAKCGSRILLSGKILVARDAAHARWKKLLDEGKNLPEYTKKYPICYAGPARTPDGAAIGSFGPTTAGRMDIYAEDFFSRGASLITLAKGNRSRNFTENCGKYKAVYLGTPGGIAALIASEYVVSQKIIDYEELGMEAVRIVEVKNLPCFVLISSDGEDFYEKHRRG